MPTYIVAATKPVDESAREAIATAIADTHTRVTGASRLFAQIIFISRPPDLVTVGGAAAGEDHIFVDATIRGSRPDSIVDELIVELTHAIASAADVPPKAVWLYVRELAPARMVEYGRVLPSPGAETAWLEKALGESAGSAHDHESRAR